MIEQALLNYLHQHIGGHWVLAGGYVRDRILGRTPRDIDCFAIGGKNSISSVIAQKLEEANIPYLFEERNYQANKTARIQFMEWAVHLVPTEFDSPYEVLKRFDFNICRFYLDDKMQARPYDSADMTDLFAKNMRLEHVRTPASSLRRGYLFEYRLGFKFQPMDVKQLVDALHNGGKYDI